MSKLSAAFWLGLVLASGFTTFKVKYAVQDIEEELNRVRKHTVAEQQEIRVLAAEWTYLTQPERLAELNRRFLQLSQVAAKQLQPRIEDMPLRPQPVAPPDIVVAASQMPLSLPAAAGVDTLASAPAAAVPAVAQAISHPVQSRAAIAAAALLGMSAQAAPVRLAKAAPASLDSLIAQIAEAR